MDAPRAAVDDRSTKFCIVGAGSSGLAAARAFAAAGIPFDCLEREDDVGGNWYYGRPHSSVYASTHLISSKRLTEYLDFPMPDDFPPFPHHRQVWEYLRAYARRFALYERIEFGTPIERIEREADDRRGAWRVALVDGRVRRYRGIVVANGHNWDPRYPEFSGTFAGTALHSSQYKTPDVLADRRVLVVGGGNSGCDIACESGGVAARTFISLRRGYHFLPKFWRGRPLDALNERLLRRGVPLTVRRWLGQLVERISFGPAGSYGLPTPDHRLFETHPIINQQLFYQVAHGRVTPKPDVAELCGREVRFVDGTREPIDVVVYATGFRISFPFMDPAELNWRDGRPRLFLNVFHPEADDLFVVGLIQPDSGQFGLVDRQSRLAAAFVKACESGTPAAERFRRRKRAEVDAPLGAGIRYVDSPRHALEVEHFSYAERLQRLLAEFSR